MEIQRGIHPSPFQALYLGAPMICTHRCILYHIVYIYIYIRRCISKCVILTPIAHIYIYICRYTYVFMYAHACVRKTEKCIHTYVCEYVYIYIHKCIFFYVYVWSYICTYVYIYVFFRIYVYSSCMSFVISYVCMYVCPKPKGPNPPMPVAALDPAAAPREFLAHTVIGHSPKKHGGGLSKVPGSL